MTNLGCESLVNCDLGDKRLTARAVSIGQALSVAYGQALSMVFKSSSDLKRAYEFFANPKTSRAEIDSAASRTYDSGNLPSAGGVSSRRYELSRLQKCPGETRRVWANRERRQWTNST